MKAAASWSDRQLVEAVLRKDVGEIQRIVPWPIPVSILEPSILWFRFPFCGSGFHFMVPASIFWFRFPFCRSGFLFAGLFPAFHFAEASCFALTLAEYFVLHFLIDAAFCALIASGTFIEGVAYRSRVKSSSHK